MKASLLQQQGVLLNESTNLLWRSINKSKVHKELQLYWSLRDNIVVTDGIAMKGLLLLLLLLLFTFLYSTN